MRQAIARIVSAWAIAFIASFFLVLSELVGEAAQPTATQSELVAWLLAGAVTGAGWLSYRSDVKKRRLS